MEGEMMEQGGRCKCPHHKMTGLCVTLIGLLALLGALNVVSEQIVAIGWPILLMIIGVKKLTKGMCKCCDGGKCEGGRCEGEGKCQ